MNNKDFTHEIVQLTENLDINFKLYRDNGSFISSHWHNSIEIIYVTSGSLKIYEGNRTYNLRTNDCIVINSGVVHSTHCISGNTSILLQIPFSFLNRYIPDFKNSHFDFSVNCNEVNYEKNLNNVRKLLRDMEFLRTNPVDAGNLRFTSILFELLFQLYSNFRIPVGGKDMKRNTLSLSTFKPVLEYTKLNYNRPISIQEISEVAHLQPEYFCRKFKQCMGQTFLEYLNEIRIAHIYKDLVATDDALCNILEAHGFTNSKLFYKVFKQRFNCTPKELRKINR
ncbi:AraC family transcriptional regulator [Romboutsia sp.]|uniref:AraC family transcriptional regulator n=1 Tax=Romboutsia sp. TaxID=1965302 RepID=UPI003F3866AA